MLISEFDFERLYHTSMEWGQSWKHFNDPHSDYLPRFAAITNEGEWVRGLEINWDLSHAYWFADYASVILAREFLRTANISYQILSDEGVDGDWMIVTDFISSTWRR